jgi:hypothetical protein
MDTTRWNRNMSISKKGYIFMILLLGIAFTGIGLISAHSLNEYAGIGQVGIHGVKDTRSIHIPGDIYFNSQNGIFQRYLVLQHDISERRYVTFPDNNGTLILMNYDPIRPACDSTRDGQMWWDAADQDISICADTQWWRLHTINEP